MGDRHVEIIHRNTDYGLRALLALAVSDAPATVQELARECRVPAQFLHKVMQALAGAGIVQAQRGPGGGYRLARPPEQVGLVQIMEALQGPVAVNRCVLGRDRCANSGRCGLADTWERVQREVIGFLDGLTLARLLAEAQGGLQSNHGEVADGGAS